MSRPIENFVADGCPDFQDLVLEISFEIFDTGT